MSESWSFETKQVHAGATSDPTTGARATPIYQTTSYTFRDTEHAAALFGLTELGNIYTRIMNPTQDVLEQRVAALEGGLAAVAFASGQAAATLAILNIAEAGDHFVSTASLYGGTYNLFHYTFPKLGIEVSFVDDPDDAEEWRAKIRPNTKLLFAETLGNPRGNVLDVRKVADVAHEAGVPLMVDNTVPTPYLLRPIEHGADIVVHSATKFLGGHGTAIGGIVVDSGNVRLGRARRPLPGAHHRRTRATTASTTGRRSGRCPTSSSCACSCCATSARRSRRRTRSCSSRASRRCRCASSGTCRTRRPSRSGWRAATRWRRSYYAGLPSSPWHALPAEVHAAAAAGAVVAFDLRGGVEAGKRFVDALELHSHLANIGDVRSLVIHPASTTHSQLSGEEQLATGVTPGLVRLSVGLEGIEDIKADLDAGLPRRQGRLGDPDRDGAPSRHRRVAGGGPARPPPVGAAGRAAAAGVRRRAAGRLDRVRDVGHARARPLQRRPRAARAHRRQPRRRARGRRPPHPGLVGGRGRAGSGAGPGALVRRGPQRARRLPGQHRACRPPRRTGAPWGSRFPLVTIRDSVRAETALADALGVERWACVVGGSMGGMRALEWAATEPDRVARLFLLASPASASAEQIGWCAPQLAAIRGDLELARRRLPRRPARAGPARRAGHRPPDGAPVLPQPVRARAAVRPAGPARGGSGAAAAATPWSPTSTTTPTSWCTASTRRPTCGSRR